MITHLNTDNVSIPISPFRQHGEKATLVFVDKFCIGIQPNKILFHDGLTRVVPKDFYFYNKADTVLGYSGVYNVAALGAQRSSNWMALYAVAINDKRGIVVGSFNMPNKSNYPLLNLNFGLWQYLGVIRLQAPEERNIKHTCNYCKGIPLTEGNRLQAFSCGYWFIMDNLEYLEYKYEQSTKS